MDLKPFETISYVALRAVSGLAFAFHGMQKVFGVLSDQPRPELGSQIGIGGLIELVGGVLIAFGTAVALGLGARTFVAEAFKVPSSSMSPTLEIGDHFWISKLPWRSADRGDIIVFRYPCEPSRDYVSRVIAVANDTVEVRCGVVYVKGTAIPCALVDANATYTDRAEDYIDEVRHVSRYHESHGGHDYGVFQEPDPPAVARPRDFPSDVLPSCPRSAIGQKPGTIVGFEQPAECKPSRHYVVPDGHVFVLGDNRDNSNDSRFWGSVPVENIKGPVTGIWLPFARIGGVD